MTTLRNWLVAGACWLSLANPAIGAAVPGHRIPSSLRCLIGQGNHITNHIAGEILTRLGYKVDYATTAQAAPGRVFRMARSMSMPSSGW